jgi:tRNA-dihydrouridine synthase B
MRLSSTELGRIFLAPLSGVADSPFRRICRRFGAETVYSEMVSSEGLSRRNIRSREVFRFHEEEKPIGIQIFGKDPRRMADSAAMLEEAAPDFIDMNMSCPARKIVSRGAGCALMRDPDKAGQVARAVVRATRLAVTAKIRIGWDEQNINAIEIAKLLEDSGVAAVSVHGRTWKQGFKDHSSWNEVARVKAAVGIPVILSGDITTPEEVGQAFDETGCDAVMIGRATYGRPWVFRAIRDHLSGVDHDPPARSEIVDTILAHLDLGIAQFGERTAVVRFRKHLLWYTKAMRGVVALRPSMSKVVMRQDVSQVLSQVFPHRE